MLKPSLIAKTAPVASEEQIKIVGDLRFTYLTSRLIRVEKAPFCDKASLTVWFRRFEGGRMDIAENGKVVTAETEDVIFTVKSGKPYSVTFKDSGKTAVFSKQKNLGGTKRTLDGSKGEEKLGDGLITLDGAYLLDDSDTMLLDEDGRFTQRENGSKDYYLFAYGKNYRETINSFYNISSRTPLIPRFALGNWWSRYHAYTQKEYLDLMERFEKEDIPLTVATVDMDWHYVHNINEKFGVKYGGWTGYSWDTDLFPDYREFLRKLKEMNLHITLNLHPADGVHPYEVQYEEMAKAMGVDPSSKKKIDFRCGSDEFWNAYFDILHKPFEREGVDFWWIDWQQGKHSDVKGLDPLPALNHYHTLDNAEDGRMPMILSRYAGPGSHRYPLGFSGDTAMSWRVLDFQPYFTANAANVAYSWWSHDIGGHHEGYRDDDLYMRWIEFGIFSPIMRLHSTAIDFLGKEPWRYRTDVYNRTKELMRLRHKMIPYIFTMNYRTHEDGIALCEPMYYSYPDMSEAYNVPNQYMFGSELMVCPITMPNHKELHMGSVRAWLPEGRWVDMFTSQAYEGGRMITLLRDLETIPVLMKEGAIVPLSADSGNTCENPESFEILVASGNGEFTLIEDNGKTSYAEHKVLTKLSTSFEGDEISFTVSKAEGDISVIPEKRNYLIKVIDLEKDGEEVALSISGASVTEDHTVTLGGVSRKGKDAPKDVLINFFARWQETTFTKRRHYTPFEKLTTREEILSQLSNGGISPIVRSAIEERL